MFALGLSELEAALGTLHDVREERRDAFRARIKHLQKLGFPQGTQTGKGRRAAYDLEAIGRLVAAFELMQFGMMPSSAIALLEENWGFFRITLASAFHEILSGDYDFAMSWVWMINPQVLADLTADTSAGFGSVSAYRMKDIEKAIWREWKDDEEGLMPAVGRGYRLSLINISWALHEFLDSLPEGRDYDLDQAQADVEKWVFEVSDFNLLKDDVGSSGLTFFQGKLIGSDPQA